MTEKLRKNEEEEAPAPAKAHHTTKVKEKCVFVSDGVYKYVPDED